MDYRDSLYCVRKGGVRSVSWGEAEEDPTIGWGPGVKEVVAGGWSQSVGACGFVHGVVDKKVRNLAGNACAWVGVLGLDHTHAPAVILPFEEDVSAYQG